MFNAANVDNRSRHFVRGRVIVGTTSKVVEFLQADLAQSCPLVAVADIPAGHLVVFSAELDGFLTFDPASEVRIIADPAPFERMRFDPTAFAVVKTADPAGAPQFAIVEVAKIAGGTLTIEYNADRTIRYFGVRVADVPAGQDVIYFQPTTPLLAADFQAKVNSVFKVGEAFDLTLGTYTVAGFQQFIISAPGDN